jgi:hypothetical protein
MVCLHMIWGDDSYAWPKTLNMDFALQTLATTPAQYEERDAIYAFNNLAAYWQHIPGSPFCIHLNLSTGLTELASPSGLYGVYEPNLTMAIPASARLKPCHGMNIIILASTPPAKPGARCTEDLDAVTDHHTLQYKLVYRPWPRIWTHLMQRIPLKLMKSE